MPGSTPIYGFTYPCPGETISPMAFSTLANQIDAKMLDVQADNLLALNRPNVDLDLFGTQTINAGVDTVLTLLDSTYTINAAGVWMITVLIFPSSVGGTITSFRAHVRQNGTVRFGQATSSAGNNPCRLYPSGPIIAAVGDVITTQVQFTGTVTLDVTAELTAKMLVRIA